MTSLVRFGDVEPRVATLESQLAAIERLTECALAADRRLLSILNTVLASGELTPAQRMRVMRHFNDYLASTSSTMSMAFDLIVDGGF